VPIVLDVAGVRPDDVAVIPSELAELMALLHVVAEPAHHRDRARELSALTGRLPPQLANQLRHLAPLWARFRFRALMPLSIAPGTGHSFEDELHAMTSLPDDAFLGMATEAVAGGRLADGIDPRADEPRFLELCRTRSEAREDLGRRLLRDPAAFRDQISRVLLQCHAVFFDALWRSLQAELEQQAELLRARILPGRVAEVLASLAPDSHLFGQRQQVAFDKLQSAVVDGRGRCFALVPSVWTTPHLVVKYDAEYSGTPVPVVVQYPAAGRERDAVTLSLVQKRLTVLAEEPRLQLSRHLVNESCTTSELARLTGMTTPQVSRHLRRLKDVGLLVSVRDGRMIKHRLRSDLVYQLGHEFLSALTR
jgi:DNA-binding transcriptional ArsR family regulator